MIVKKNQKERSEKTLAVSQIFILILGTIAFSALIGFNIPVVSGGGGSCKSVDECAFGLDLENGDTFVRKDNAGAGIFKYEGGKLYFKGTNKEKFLEIKGENAVRGMLELQSVGITNTQDNQKAGSPDSSLSVSTDGIPKKRPGKIIGIDLLPKNSIDSLGNPIQEGKLYSKPGSMDYFVYKYENENVIKINKKNGKVISTTPLNNVEKIAFFASATPYEGKIDLKRKIDKKTITPPPASESSSTLRKNSNSELFHNLDSLAVGELITEGGWIYKLNDNGEVLASQDGNEFFKPKDQEETKKTLKKKGFKLSGKEAYGPPDELVKKIDKQINNLDKKDKNYDENVKNLKALKEDVTSGSASTKALAAITSGEPLVSLGLNGLNKLLSSNKEGSDSPVEVPTSSILVKKNKELGLGLATSFGYASLVFGSVQGLATAIGASDSESLALSISSGLGTLVGGVTDDLITRFAEKGGHLARYSLLYSIGAGVVTAVSLYLILHKTTEEEVIKFECLPWQAPLGGNNCELCNNQLLPCSEYQCKSLGQGCQIENAGTEDAVCSWVNKDDVNPPIINPNVDALNNLAYEYTPSDAISPDKGVEIVNKESQKGDGCVPAYSPLSFGVSLDEPARCKLDLVRQKNYEDMQFTFSQGIAGYNHSYQISVPGVSGNETEITGTVGENLDIFVRCQDLNGNSNEANFVFRTCIDSSLDTTAPIIKTTSIRNDQPVAFDVGSVKKIGVYINEPVKACKWSKQDVLYGQMEGSMDCSKGDSVGDINKLGLYTCIADFEGVKNEENNNFYIKCEDKAGNKNQESYLLNLKGTKSLVLNSAGPNGTLISDSVSPIKVTLTAKTTAGADNGKSQCAYSPTGITGSYNIFLGDEKYDKFEHAQELFLKEGSYLYYIRCTDLGGNSDEKIISFKTQVDSLSPIITNTIYESQYLKVSTNEIAECVYDTKDCNYAFEDGLPSRLSGNNLNHFFDWKVGQSYYIKCADDFGNKPLPNECSRIVKSFENIQLQ